MEAPNECWGVFEVACRLPGRVVVTDPTNKVLELSSNEFVVENFFDFPLKVFVNNDSRGSWLNLTCESILGDRFKEGDVEDWVNFHSRREVQLISMV